MLEKIDVSLLNKIRSLMKEFNDEYKLNLSENDGIITEFLAWVELEKLNNKLIKVRKAIHIKQEGNLCLYFYEDDGNLRHLIAVPPGSKPRTDIFTEEKYLYNYTKSVKKLRGKFIVIKVKDNKIQEFNYLEH